MVSGGWDKIMKVSAPYSPFVSPFRGRSSGFAEQVWDLRAGKSTNTVSLPDKIFTMSVSSFQPRLSPSFAFSLSNYARLTGKRGSLRKWPSAG